jgi:hypothetical protein
VSIRVSIDSYSRRCLSRPLSRPRAYTKVGSPNAAGSRGGPPGVAAAEARTNPLRLHGRVMSTHRRGGPLEAGGSTARTPRSATSSISSTVSAGGFRDPLVVRREESKARVHSDATDTVTRARRGGTCGGGVHGAATRAVTRAWQGGACSSGVHGDVTRAVGKGHARLPRGAQRWRMCSYKGHRKLASALKRIRTFYFFQP